MARYITTDGHKRSYPSLKRIKRLADRIYSKLLLFADRKIGQNEMLEMSKRLVDVFKPPKPETIVDCLLPIYDMTPSKYDIEVMAWRLAANAKRIRNSIPVPYWCGQLKEEPAICQFICPENEQSLRNGYVKYCVLTGPAACAYGRIHINERMLRKIPYYPIHTYNDHVPTIRELSAIVFTCILMPSIANYPKVDVSSVRDTQAIRRRNRVLIDMWEMASANGSRIIVKNAYYIPVIINGVYTKDLVISF